MKQASRRLFRFLTPYGTVCLMSVRMRHTSSHTKNRRSHHALAASSIVTDKDSGALRLPHRLDETTGKYRGMLIVPERKKALKKEEKRRERNEGKKEEMLNAGMGHKEPVHVEEKQPDKKGVLGRMTKGRVTSRNATGS